MEWCLVRKKLLSLKQKKSIGVGFERGLLTVEFTYSGHKERERERVKCHPFDKMILVWDDCV